MTQIKYPFGASDQVALTATGAQAIAVDNAMTVVDGVTVQATGNRTINLTIDDDVPVGAKMFIKTKTNATETTAYGTGMLGATLTGVAGKTFGVLFVFDGTNFVEAGTPVQVD